MRGLGLNVGWLGQLSILCPSLQSLIAVNCSYSGLIGAEGTRLSTGKEAMAKWGKLMEDFASFYAINRSAG